MGHKPMKTINISTNVYHKHPQIIVIGVQVDIPKPICFDHRSPPCSETQDPCLRRGSILIPLILQRGVEQKKSFFHVLRSRIAVRLNNKSGLWWLHNPIQNVYTHTHIYVYILYIYKTHVEIHMSHFNQPSLLYGSNIRFIRIPQPPGSTRHARSEHQLMATEVI